MEKLQLGMAKTEISISIDVDTLYWVRREIEKKRFASVSHAVEYALHLVREDQ